MIEKIDFNYFPNIQKLLLEFIKQSEAYDVSNAILKYEQMNYGYMIKLISQQISTNPTDHWVEMFELEIYHQTSSIILYYCIGYYRKNSLF